MLILDGWISNQQGGVGALCPLRLCVFHTQSWVIFKQFGFFCRGFLYAQM